MPTAQTVFDTSLRYVGAAIYFIVLVCLITFLIGGLIDKLEQKKRKDD